MGVQILHNGADITSNVLAESVRWTENLTNKADEFGFSVVGNGSMPVTIDKFDEIKLIIDSVTVFGGRVMRYRDTVESRQILYREIECKDWSIDLDRFAWSGSFSQEKTYNIIRDMLHTANKREEVRIADMGTDESWSAGSADTTNYRVEAQSLKLAPSSTSYVTANLALAVTRDLSGYDNIEFDAFIDDITKFGSLRLKLGDSSLTNYYSIELSSGLVQNWNKIIRGKGDFSTTGSPDWASIEKIEVAAKANAAVTVNVSFDDVFATTDDAITMAGVDDNLGLTVETAIFNERFGSNVLKRLADLYGWDWYISPEKAVNFFDPEGNNAPFNLEDDNEKFIWPSLVLGSDITKLVNVIKIFGGPATEESQTIENLDYQADGTNTVFQLAALYDKDEAYTLEVDPDGGSGYSAVTVGIDGEDDMPTSGALWNPDEKTITFDSAPGASAKVKWTGYRIFPLAIKIADSISITNNGWEQELVIKDEQITTYDSAIQRAIAEFTQYANRLVEGSFQTYSGGLRAGQRIKVMSTIRGVSEWYVIQRVNGIMRTEDEMVFTVDMVTARTYDAIDVLQRLLLNEVREITDYQNDRILSLIQEVITIGEVVSVVEPYEVVEAVGVTDQLTYDLEVSGDPYSYVAGNYEPTDNNDQTRTPCADGGAVLAS